MFPTKRVEPRCSFCGKGPFKTDANLHRHISNSLPCQKTYQHDFGVFTGGIWQSGPTTQPFNEPLKEASTDTNILQEDVGFEVDNLDFDLLDDFDIEVVNNGINDNEIMPGSVNPIPQSATHFFTAEIANEKQPKGRYIEDFNNESLAGAAWGRAMPLFEALRLRQEDTGSRWDPFEDEDEWELAQWLIENVGQKKTDEFLRMRIVNFSFPLPIMLRGLLMNK